MQPREHPHRRSRVVCQGAACVCAGGGGRGRGRGKRKGKNGPKRSKSNNRRKREGRGPREGGRRVGKDPTPPDAPHLSFCLMSNTATSAARTTTSTCMTVAAKATTARAHTRKRRGPHRKFKNYISRKMDAHTPRNTHTHRGEGKGDQKKTDQGNRPCGERIDIICLCTDTRLSVQSPAERRNTRTPCFWSCVVLRVARALPGALAHIPLIHFAFDARYLWHCGLESPPYHTVGTSLRSRTSAAVWHRCVTVWGTPLSLITKNRSYHVYTRKVLAAVCRLGPRDQ